MRSRHFSMKLPSLRERSNETSGDQHQDRIDISAWTGTWPEYLEYLATFSRGKGNSAASPPGKIHANTKKVASPNSKCTSPGNGNLTLDMFPLPDTVHIEDRARNVSNSSSSYDDDPTTSNNGRAAKRDAPASPPPKNTLQLSDIEKYSRANDRLSNLRSSSGSVDSGGRSVHGAAEDAAMAVQGWESLLRQSNVRDRHATRGKMQRERADELFLQYDDEARRRTASQGRTLPFVGKSFLRRGSQSQFHNNTDKNKTRNASQLDGTADFNHTMHGTDSSEEPLSPIQGTKRKASHFSLRSLSSSFAAKRPRLSLRKLATSVSTGLTQVKRSLKQRNADDRRNFEAWKAQRRRIRPGDALKGKHEGGYGEFNFERSRHGHKDWWREGVCKYEAPSWMDFGSKVDDASTSSRLTQLRLD